MNKSYRRLFLLVFIYVSCNEISEYPSSCENIKNKYDSYLLKSSEDNYRREVLKNLEKIEKKDNRCIYSSLLGAELLLLQYDTSAAKSKFINVITKDDKNVYALFNLGKIYLHQGGYDSAIKCFRYAARLKSGNGVIIDRTNEFSKIVNESNFYIAYSEIIFNNALASYHAGYLFDANHEFKYCINNKKRLGESYYYLGLIFSKIDSLDNACSYMQLSKSHGYGDADIFLQRLCNR